jgi:hypothetical protein
LENWDAEEYNNNETWEEIREDIRITAKESVSCYELKKHKPWFDDDAQNY